MVNLHTKFEDSISPVMKIGEAAQKQKMGVVWAIMC